MKLSFSTKGWHNNTFDEFCEIATDLKFQGIELHNIYNRLFTDKDGAFNEYTAAKTVRKLYSMKLSLPCIDSICDPADKNSFEDCVNEINKCIEIAATLHIPNVRIHASDKFSQDEAVEAVNAVLSAVIENAETKNVTLLIETTGVFCNTAILRELLDSYARD